MQFSSWYCLHFIHLLFCSYFIAYISSTFSSLIVCFNRPTGCFNKNKNRCKFQLKKSKQTIVSCKTPVLFDRFLSAHSSKSTLALSTGNVWHSRSEQVVCALCVSDPLSLLQNTRSELPGGPAASLSWVTSAKASPASWTSPW